ncbi:S-methyl-5'-thioadenosine phosphorylase [Paractinoplanes durhamensis]|uniref:Purine nucleoside phosphorylase n=1 Tax=Paractinoplanes durhamensis TaxID=113563 RepID=A0ABQ3YYK0_9ACTN|nr:S-methyl-5'-thioadenosine phosphorylase [Actinoplanes durhamensis]GIE02604.1 purine nucleoside phosphorylase [Actinoplanes durhamensis]
MNAAAEIGVIGGSGLYALLENAVEVEVSTPYGPPSDPITVAQVGDRRVAFLPRHGRDHRFPPHKIPYRANLWALRALGVRQIVAPCAVGGLRPELGPGTFVVPDQLIDRTSGRVQTFYDEGAVHVSFADPYCPAGRGVLLAAARDVAPVDGGAMVVVEGPRFSTRAESRWFTSIGGAVVNMTGHPEAVLARELALCYTTIALVTDLDAGVEGDEGVTQEEVFRVFAENTERLRGVLLEAVTELPVERACPCSAALDGIKLPFALP